MKVFVDSVPLPASDINEYLVNTIYAIKPADTIRSNTTTVNADPDLSVNLVSAHSYRLDVVILYDSSTTAGFRFRFFASAGVVLYGLANGVFAGSPGVWWRIPYGLLPAQGQQGLGDNQVLVGEDPFDSVATVSGILVTGANGGSFSFAWAQNVANAFNTTVRTGSSMYLRRVS